MIGQLNDTHNTRIRLLRAAELLYIEHGYAAMSLRLITQQAEANMAAVNYYFGSKRDLVSELLDQRFNRLNAERLQLLDACEQHLGKQAMDVSMVLSVLFVPALRMGRDGTDGQLHMQLIRRAYTDTSLFVRTYLQRSHQSIAEAFLVAFARALPQLSRHDLGMRLQLGQQVLACLLGSNETGHQITALSHDKPISDTQVLARLLALIEPMLNAPIDVPERIHHVDQVMGLADVAAQKANAQMPTVDHTASLLRRSRIPFSPAVEGGRL